ncbi:hypothetical protein ATK36_0033 [Amycolatopsis sulphurea]|uniref:DUF3592 domain-containing protein n=1 Tax=Amycolatopsis sulphurea TaxID=76022 RepID=A0A2A9FYH3_9PSEU|nr:DUF3592 domain-containing protein [Amycolatopsis sulphurea]PFG56517.1 hypothetical protein ATK36_0033 [Amycolatopsis sulphurea]
MRNILRLRPVHHILVTSAAVLLACAAVLALQLAEFGQARAALEGFGPQTTATVTGSAEDSATVRFAVPGRPDVSATIGLDSTPPANGSRVPVRYDPADPARAVIPGATPLITADRASTYATVTVVAALAVLLVTGFLLLTRFVRPARAAVRSTVPVRRVKLQRGLLTRSWLETEGATPRWIPVYFSPTLIGLPSPVKVEVLGDLRQDRHVAVRVAGEVLYPAGATRMAEPRGRRTDNPAGPDEERSAAAVRPVPLRHQFRTDLPVLAVAPVAGVFWALVDGSGFTGWLVVTVLIAAFGFWWAALRGSDPS